MHDQMHAHKHLKACKPRRMHISISKHAKLHAGTSCKYAALCVYTYAVCTVGLRNLTFHGEKDAKGEDNLAKQQLESGHLFVLYALYDLYALYALFSTLQACSPLWSHECGSSYYTTGMCSRVNSNFRFSKTVAPALQSTRNNLPCGSNPGFEVRGNFCSLIASVPLRKQSDVSV